MLNCLNINGWSETSRELKINILTSNKPDILCLSETHLTHFEYINIEGYKYYGKAREGLKRSGGVAILIANWLFSAYSLMPCCTDTDGILAVKLTHRETGYEMIVVCNYLPPVSSIYGKDPEGFFTRLLMLSYEFNTSDIILFCGDFNARIGHIQDAPFADGIHERTAIDNTVNTHGRDFLNFLSDSACCILNGRCEGESGYTCTTACGSSVVDYIAVPYENLQHVVRFQTKSMNNLIHELGLEGFVTAGAAPPDHNMLTVEFKSTGLHLLTKGLGCPQVKKGVPRKFKKEFMNTNGAVNMINRFITVIKENERNQSHVDKCYTELCEFI